MATNGYPGAYEKGSIIGGTKSAIASDDVILFHAGTTIDADGTLCAAGGRVLAVTGLGLDVSAARDAAYKAVDAIDWPEGFCRRDIAAT
jgi:phosphoribosylamine--glycine ligase